MRLATIRPRAFALGVHYIKGLTVGRDRNRSRIPARWNMLHHLHALTVDHRYGIDARLRNIEPPIPQR